MKNLKLPKSVYLTERKLKKMYHVSIHSKKYNKTIHVGYFDNIQDAITSRDKFIVENYSDITEGYLPRGITKNGKNFLSFFLFKGSRKTIGTFPTIKEAVDARNNFIDSLK